jgi:CheY-like chemotaxis protein
LTEVIQEFLVDGGFDVSVCKRGENGYVCVVAGQPDLVMLDLRFGDEEYGWRILDQLILNPATRCIPVIVSSGSVESLRTQATALLAQSGHCVLPKPFDLDGLLGTVETAECRGRDDRPRGPAGIAVFLTSASCRLHHDG